MPRKNGILTAEQKEALLKEWNGKTNQVKRLCSKYGVSSGSIWRWKRLYSGTTESLANQSRIQEQYYNEHTKEEIDLIKNAIEQHPNCGTLELFSILKQKSNYNRSFHGLDRFVRKNGYMEKVKTKKLVREREKTKTPITHNRLYVFGFMQMDVRKVPNICYAGNDKKDFYLYHITDEATMERFSYPYENYNQENSIDFLKRALHFYGYIPFQIKNETVSTFADYLTYRENDEFKKFCLSLEIVPLFVKQNDIPNLKRCHRTDNAKLYPSIRFKTLDELKHQTAIYLERINNTLSPSLKNPETKTFRSPIIQRAIFSQTEIGQQLIHRYKSHYNPND